MKENELQNDVTENKEQNIQLGDLPLSDDQAEQAKGGYYDLTDHLELGDLAVTGTPQGTRKR
jgi:hypothetical protein